MNANTPALRPRLGRERLIIDELADEILVYDLDRHKAPCLNQTAALVWKLRDRLGKVQRLSAAERWMLAQTLVLLPLTQGGVYSLGVSRWQAVLARLALRRRNSGPDAHLAPKRSSEDSIALAGEEATNQRARAIARLVKIAAHHGLYRARCLPQSLVLWSLLRQNGIESEIRFGIRKEEGQLHAHAWVECLGIALNEDRDVTLDFVLLESEGRSGQTSKVIMLS